MTNKDLPSVIDAAQQQSMGPLQLNHLKYIDYIDDPHLTDEQKKEFLQTLWTIMAAFVDLGFGVDSVMPILERKAFDCAENALEESIPTHEFNVAAQEVADEEAE